MAAATLKIVIDKAEVESMVAEMESLVGQLSDFNRGQLSELFRRLGAAALLNVQQDNGAALAGELHVSVQPTERFRSFMAALRAGQIDQCFVKE